jgi:transposase
MTTMAQMPGPVTVGVDTHSDVHVGAVVDEVGQVLGTVMVRADPSGFRELERFALGFGAVAKVGVEGTGAYGAELARWLRRRGHEVIEVDRPDRRLRRAQGKSDPIDACSAARQVLSGQARGVPKTRDGLVEQIRVLRVARRSAIRSRTQTMNQLHNLVLTSPGVLRQRLRELSGAELVRRALAFRVAGVDSPVDATRFAMRELARRHRFLTGQIEDLDRHLEVLVRKEAPGLLQLKGVGTGVAGALLVTAGDNPERLRSESSFAHLCGVAPLPASSGTITRHRLNRGGDRAANNALWTIVMVRMSCDERTRTYVARRTAEGRSKPEIIRCLKRYVAREVFAILTS